MNKKRTLQCPFWGFKCGAALFIGHEFPAIEVLKVPVIAVVKAFQFDELRFGHRNGFFIHIPVHALGAGRGG